MRHRFDAAAQIPNRWRIDAEGFQTIMLDGHLKHPAVHPRTVLIVPAMIRLLAYALSLVFCRCQIRSQARGAISGLRN